MDSDKEKRKYIIDTSAFTTSPSAIKGKNNLVSRVYQGLFAQSEEPFDILDQHNILLAELDYFFKYHEGVFINEVLKENSAFLRYLNEQRKIVKKMDKYEDLESNHHGFDESFARKLDNYIKHFLAFNNYFQRRVLSLNDFNPLQRLVYDKVLEKTRNIHQSHQQRGNKQTLGDRLETDRKIIATAIATAVKYPVTVISRDIQLIGEPDLQERGSLRKVIEECKFWARTSDGLNVNPQNISVYNPNRSSNGFYDSDKERVVYERANVRTVR